ncbi:MAG: aminoacyl-tRNA hydrolase [Patescibacteria group bacterium]
MEQKFNPEEVSLIIGLGNPEKSYEKTYHNAGALYLAHLLSVRTKDPLPLERVKTFAYGVAGTKTLIRSLAPMNESGLAVAAALKYFNKKPGSLLVIQDDSDLTLGTYKFSFGRGAAGHNGILSIMRTLHTKDFWRLRIGIRPPSKEGEGREKALDFVLKKISPAAIEKLQSVFTKIDAVLFLKEKIAPKKGRAIN